MAVEDESVSVEKSDKNVGKKHFIKATVLDSFTQLANNSQQTRINGGLKLLSYLFTNDNDEEAKKEVNYALNRMIKGVASDRLSAREGYFTALTVFLANKTDMTITSVLQVLNKELQIGGQSKSETGEICTGHVLTCGAVLRSGLFLRSSGEEQALLLSTMLTAANKKTYLGLAAYSFIVDFIEMNSEEAVSEKLWPHLKATLSCPLTEHNLDSLYCLLALSAKYPSVTKRTIKKKMGYPTLLCSETEAIICEKIMNAPEFASVNHPIYETFGKMLANSEHLISFWTNGLEIKLSLRNQNRIMIVLTILFSVLKNINENSKDIPQLLSNKFIPTLLEWFKSAGHVRVKKFRGKQKRTDEENDGRQVVMRAKEVFDTLIETLKKEHVGKEVTLHVLEKVLFYPGDIMFGEITNSKIVKFLIENLDADGVKSFSDTLKKVVANDSKKMLANHAERPWTNMERLRAAEMLTHLINHKATADNVKWRIKKMQFLLKMGLFKSAGSEESGSVSSELAAAIKKCFFRCLNFTMPKLETLLKVLTSLVDYTDELLSDEASHKKLSKPISPQVLESWKAMKKFTKKLVISSSDDSSKANTVFQILSLHSGLFLFSDVMNEEMAQSSLQEVQSCYEHYIKDSKPGKKKKNNESMKEGEIVDEEPEWIEVLVDVFLNFLSRDSYLLRSVVQCVFRLLCEYLTPSAIGQIVSVLDPDNETNPLSRHGDPSDDEVSDEENDNAESEDDDNEGKEDDDNDGKEGEDDEESSEDEDVDDNITMTDQLRMAVQKALGAAAPETDTESINADDIGEEEGRKLDEALSDAFRMLKQSKGKKTKKDKKNDKILMDFRIRVLDLIDIYLEKEPSMELCLGMLSPLTRCLEFSIKDSDQQQLEAKVRKCLKCLTSVKSFSSTEGVSIELLADYLKAITNRGSRTQFVFQALGDVISKCSTFIVRCSQKIKSSQTPSKKKKKHKPCPLLEIYKDSLATFFIKRDCLLPVILFHDLLQLAWEGKWELLPVILDHAYGSVVRQFRKNESLEMLNIFYKNLKRDLRIETAPEISAKLLPIEQSLSDNAVSYLGNNEDVNERFFVILMKLFVTVKSYHTSVKESQDNMAWEKIKPVVQESRKTLRLKNTQDYFKLCNLLGLEKIKNNQVKVKKVEEKESTDSGHDSNTDGEDEVELESKESKKMKKRKINGSVENGVSSGEKVEKKKKPMNRVKKEISKKEAKRLRAEASSEGLQNLSFCNLESNIDVDTIGEQMIDSDDNTPRKRKNSDEGKIGRKLKKSKSFS